VSRTVSAYVCQTCGAQTRQFFGRCSNCGDWNSILEQVIPSCDDRTLSKKLNTSLKQAPIKSEPISNLTQKRIERISSGFQEFDRVLGGGLVPGSLVLVGGDPGIGKSTLLLQSATEIASEKSVLYVSAEESAQQVKLRWERLKETESKLQLLAETDLDAVIQEITSLKPDVVVIDSIQALHDRNLSSSPGSVAQVRECSASLQKVAKEIDTSLLIVGHVTKEGMLAGPKVLEHLVDVVLTFEGDRFVSHRLLRAVKNRYGATHELGIFEMQSQGLTEINNPSEIFLSGESASGVATIVSSEGSRSIVVDLQALVSITSYSSPRRTTTGISINRLHQIIAVLEKHMGLELSRFDCYLAVAGGLEVEEPAADLGIAAALLSSFKNISITSKTALIGELGLGGQIRSVSQLNQRLQEAQRMGFQRAVIPASNGLKPLEKEIQMEILKAKNISQALSFILS